MTPLRIFIGWDWRESIAYHVLSHSIITRSSIPVSITPLRREMLRSVHHRARGPLDSTDFSITRFLVPALCGYEGDALYMDCDMVCLADIAKLVQLVRYLRGWHSVAVVQHNYVPKSDMKFLGETQTTYPMKNWSSLMYFDNEKCRQLTPEYVETAPGLDLHQFKWTTGIGALPLEWNWLHGEYESNADAKILHYTLGGPWFKYDGSWEHDVWKTERDLMGG